jgi:predicted anti-sigma-YlaC factor YlaD
MISEIVALVILALAIPLTFSLAASGMAEILGSLFAIKTTKNKSYIIQLLLALLSSTGYGLLLLLELYYAVKTMEALGL